jgi:hypothetical protein
LATCCALGTGTVAGSAEEPAAVRFDAVLEEEVSSAIACGTHVKIASDNVRQAAVSFLGNWQVVTHGAADFRARSTGFVQIGFHQATARVTRGTQLTTALWRKRFWVKSLFATRQSTALPGGGSLSRAYQLYRRKNSMLPARRAFQAQFDLDGIKLQFSHDAAECVPVYAEFSRCLALVAFIVAQDFLNVTATKLADSLLVGDATGVHLYDKIIQFAFHL